MIAISLGWVVILMCITGVLGLVFGIRLGIKWDKRKE